MKRPHFVFADCTYWVLKSPELLAKICLWWPRRCWTLDTCTLRCPRNRCCRYSVQSRSRPLCTCAPCPTLSVLRFSARPPEHTTQNGQMSLNRWPKPARNRRRTHLGERFSDHVTEHRSLLAGPPGLDSGHDFDLGHGWKATKKRRQNIKKNRNTQKLKTEKRTTSRTFLYVLWTVRTCVCVTSEFLRALQV